MMKMKFTPTNMEYTDRSDAITCPFKIWLLESRNLSINRAKLINKALATSRQFAACKGAKEKKTKGYLHIMLRNFKNSYLIHSVCEGSIFGPKVTEGEHSLVLD